MATRMLLYLFICLLFSISNISFAQPPKLMLPIGHTEGVSIATFSVDSRLLLTASADKTAKLWQVSTGHIIADLKGHNSWIRAIGFVPGGKYVYTCDDSIRIWNTSNTTAHLTIAGKFPERSKYSFTPDGSKMIFYTYDSVIIRQVEDGKKIASFYSKDINTASFSPDGKFFMFIDNDGAVKIYTTNNQLPAHIIQTNKKGIIDARYSPDGKMILITSADKSITLWNSNGMLLHTLAEFKKSYGIADFSRDSKYVIGREEFNSKDTIKIWRTTDGVLEANLKGKYEGFQVSGDNFSADGNQLVLPYSSLYKSNMTAIYSFPAGTKLKEIEGHTGDIKYTVWSPNGKYIATASEDKTIKLYNAADFLLHANLKGKTKGKIPKAVFSDKYMSLDIPENPSIWNLKEGALENGFYLGDDELKLVRFSPDNKYILTFTGNQEIRLWDAATQSLLVNNLKKDIPNTYVNYQGTFEFTSNSKKILIANHDMAAHVFESSTGKLLNTLNNDWFIEKSAISPNGNYATMLSKDTVKILDLLTNKEINRFFLGDQNNPDSISFSNSGEQILFFYSNNIKIFNIKSKKPTALINASQYSALVDNKNKLLTVEGNTIRLWNIESGKMEFEFRDTDMNIYNNTGNSFKCILRDNYLIYNCSYSIKIIDIKNKLSFAELKNFYGGQPNSICFNKDKTQLAVAYSNGTIKIWELVNSTLVKELKGHIAGVNNVYYLNNDKQLLTVSDDNTAKIWEAFTGKELYTFFALNNKDYFIKEPSGYYMSTQKASKLLYYVTGDLKVIPFEQLDVKYNRPDKISEVINGTDTALINSYKKAYEKRIRKLNIDTSSFKEGYNVPEAFILNAESINIDQKSKEIKIHIRATDSTTSLDRFNVWVNESPVYGMRGINIRNRNKKYFDTTITITLSEGINRIETTVLNKNSIESYRMPVYVKYTPAVSTIEKIYFIGIGIDKFTDPKYNLKWSVKDITDLTAKLKEKNKEFVLVDTLFNERVTIENIKALKKKLLTTTENDKVIIAYSGHGLLSNDYDYYLSTYSIDFKQPQKNGLPYEALESLLDSIPARKKLMLIDACHSGEVDKEELRKMKKTQNELDGTKGIIEFEETTNKKLGMKNSFELMQELFANVNKSTGATIISAAAGTQFALERGDLKNGVFTYCILEAMEQNTTMNVSGLKQKISARVEELTKGMQKPTSRNEALEYDWQVW